MPIHRRSLAGGPYTRLVTDVRPTELPPEIPADTSVEAWKFQMAALRRLSLEQRSRYWSELQSEMDAAQRGAIHRKYPDLDERTAMALLVQRRHGRELAQAVYPEIDLSRLR